MRVILRKRGSSEQSVRQQRFGALRDRNFVTLWLDSITSNAGSQMQAVAATWLIVQFTNSPVALAIAGLCYSVPVILLPPLGGILADRGDRITVIKIAQALNTIQPLVLAALIATGRLQLGMLYADTFIAATIYALGTPSLQAILPAIVRREHLLSAVALQSIVYTGATLIGPGLGGILLLLWGPAWLYAINGLTTIPVVIALFMLKDVRGRSPEQQESRKISGSGARYIWEHKPVLAMLLIIALLTMLTGSYRVLLPFFARDIWRSGASGYGWLVSATGVGTLVGTFALSALGDLRQKTRVVLSMCLLMGISLVVFAISPFYALGLAMLMLAGLAFSVANAVLVTQIQLVTDDAVLGRVMAFRSIAFVGVENVGSIITGGLAQLLGSAIALVGSSLVATLATALLTRPLSTTEGT